ncbi:hypothetical protein EYF80_061452 [Liparis tanakae]|uniref:Uncharacterized protein n=1 Tax=Liparis tanakae TaxID=230148 RepID=A0A4Z2EHY5_9TELE|nr:hypothetical protein EYF80_061452 [Liparis tanakae]
MKERERQTSVNTNSRRSVIGRTHSVNRVDRAAVIERPEHRAATSDRAERIGFQLIFTCESVSGTVSVLRRRTSLWRPGPVGKCIHVFHVRLVPLIAC